MTSDLLEELKNEPKPSPDGLVLDFTVTKSALNKALSEVAPAAPSGDVMPILKNFHFAVSGTSLKVTASDGTHTMLVSTDVLKGAHEGTSIFPPARTLSIVHEAADDIRVQVVCKSQKFVARIKSGSASWTFPLLGSAAKYPDFSVTESIGTVPVDAQDLLAALSQVRKAASSDTMRPYYMMVDISKDRARASDGVRFQQVKYEFPFDCQIPIRAVNMVVSRIKADDTTVEVGQTNKALLFRINETLLISQKVPTQFPDVDEVLLLPTLANDQKLSVDRAALLGAIRRVRIMADESTSSVVLSLNKGSVSVQSKDTKGAVSVESVDAVWDLSPRHISFNHEHLSDMLSSTSSETCEFRLGKDLLTKPSPLLMEDKESGLTAVLSQIRLDWL